MYMYICGAGVIKKEKRGYFCQADVYINFHRRHFQNSPTPKHILQILPSTSTCTFISLRSRNDGWTREMQQNPTHCQAPTNAPTVAQQGTNIRQSYPLGRTGRTRGRLRWNELSTVRRPGNLLEPPGFQEAFSRSRRGIRV